MIQVIACVEKARWEIWANGQSLGFHKRSDVCDYWAEQMAKELKTTVNHWAEMRPKHMAEMEFSRKQKKTNETKSKNS